MDYINVYRTLIVDTQPATIDQLKTGALIQFFHNNEIRIGIVVAPDYLNKMHVISLTNIEPALYNYLSDTVLKVDIKSKTTNKDTGAQDFYRKLVPYLHGIDAYRSYKLENVKNLSIIEFGGPNRIPDELEEYRYYKNYTREAALKEAEEYFDNDFAFNLMPNAFKDKNELVEAIMNARVVYFSKTELINNMITGDAGEILTSDNPKKRVIELARLYERDWKSIQEGIDTKSSMFPTILINTGVGYHILAGNTRVMVGCLNGLSMPLKIIDRIGSVDYSGWAAKKLELKNNDFENEIVAG